MDLETELTNVDVDKITFLVSVSLYDYDGRTVAFIRKTGSDEPEMIEIPDHMAKQLPMMLNMLGGLGA